MATTAPGRKPHLAKVTDVPLDEENAKAAKEASFHNTHARDGAAIGNDVPLDDDAPADSRSQLSKLALSMMGCQPELSMKKEQTVTMDGREQKVVVGKPIHQATIFGYITGLTGPKELPNAKTPEEKITYGLMGNIEGRNELTGELFKAGILYMPGGFHDMMLADAELALKSGDVNTRLPFALEMWSIPADNPRGYSWKAVSKLPMQKEDPLARLRARALAPSPLKALPGNGSGTAQGKLAAS